MKIFNKKSISFNYNLQKSYKFLLLNKKSISFNYNLQKSYKFLLLSGWLLFISINYDVILNNWIEI